MLSRLRTVFLVSLGILSSVSQVQGADTSFIGSQKIWSYYYYADPDPAFNRVVVMDPKSMTEVGSIWVPGLSPHSADRAGSTNKM